MLTSPIQRQLSLPSVAYADDVKFLSDVKELSKKDVQAKVDSCELKSAICHYLWIKQSHCTVVIGSQCMTTSFIGPLWKVSSVSKILVLSAILWDIQATKTILLVKQVKLLVPLVMLFTIQIT